MFVLRPSLAFSRLLDSLVLVGVLLKRRGPHYTHNYTHNFDSERETIMAARKRERVGELSLAQVKKFQANQARKAANKMGAEGPKRSTPRTARTRKK